MMTIFDFVTVACFLGMVGAFFLWMPRDPRTLLHLMLCGVLFAVANQLGNAGYVIFAMVLIAAGVAYCVLLMRR